MIFTLTPFLQESTASRAELRAQLQKSELECVKLTKGILKANAQVAHNPDPADRALMPAANQVEELQGQQQQLLSNISSVFKTAQREIKRRDADIEDLQKQSRTCR